MEGDQSMLCLLDIHSHNNMLIGMLIVNNFRVSNCTFQNIFDNLYMYIDYQITGGTLTLIDIS